MTSLLVNVIAVGQPEQISAGLSHQIVMAIVVDLMILLLQE